MKINSNLITTTLNYRTAKDDINYKDIPYIISLPIPLSLKIELSTFQDKMTYFFNTGKNIYTVIQHLIPKEDELDLQKSNHIIIAQNTLINIIDPPEYHLVIINDNLKINKL